MNTQQVLSENRHWQASLSLAFAHSNFGTQLTKARRSGPLSVQKAFYPEGRNTAHCYLLHPPAGIVSGDELDITITAEKAAHALITTPGANRFYRAREDLSIGTTKQLQTTSCVLYEKAILENLPLETIVYPGADGYNTVDVHLCNSSVYLGWDISCLGLPSSEQPFTHGQYTQLNRIFIDKQMQYHDRICISDQNQLLHAQAGLAYNTVFGTFTAYCPEQQLNKPERIELVEQMREKIISLDAEKRISITDLRGLIVIRYLGSHAEHCKSLFIELWQLIRPAYIGIPGVAPRIWHT